MDSIVNFLASIINWINEFFINGVEIIKKAFIWFADMFLGWLSTFAHLLFDSALDLVAYLYHLIDFNIELFDTSLAWSGMPDQVIYVCNAIGLPHCFMMLTTALGIRLALNLIPASLTRI